MNQVSSNRPEARAHIYISGRVQGVGFRFHTQQQAHGLGVTGWVRNLWDGRVEAIFEGRKTQVERAVAWCNRGAPSGHVDRVELHWERPTGEFSSFSIRHSS